MNSWVEGKTNFKIKNLIPPEFINNNTKIVLVNAIYFLGNWSQPFNASLTFKGPFFFNNNTQALVDFMKIKKPFKYGNFKELDATAIEMDYKNSNISMIFILPNSRAGLNSLEKKLHFIDFKELYNRMFQDSITVELPKFKIEFDINLNDPLMKVLNQMIILNN
jgi:serpin B